MPPFARGLLLVLLLPLAACDSTGTPSALVAQWTLEEVSDAITDHPVSGPIGSILLLEEDGSLRIDSGNDCSGTYDAEFVVNMSVLTLDYDACTEIGTTPETDLSLILPGTGRNGIYFSMPPGDSPRLLMNGLDVDGRVLDLTFIAHSR